MNPQEDFKRKYAGIANYKSSGSTNNLINGKQWKKSDISREKEDKKILVDNRPQAKISPHIHDQNSKANPKLINFRNLKEALPKKQATTLVKNSAYIVKPSLQYFPKNTKPSQQPHGISINVNIQNMLPQKSTEANEPLPLSDRSLIQNDKKNKKTPIHVPQKFDDFQCTQELIFKKTPIEKKNKFVDKTVQKNPLIDMKYHKIQMHQKPKDKQLQVKQALKKFQSQVQTINSAFEAQTISYLDCRQLAYIIQPNYIQKYQKQFSWKMRATLFEWMMHVSYQFSMKRQTFYLAVNLVDLFLSKEHNLPKSDFQLSGAAAMFIASKLQQFEPKCSEQFATATNTYNATEVKQMQKRICKALKYMLNPPTLFVWANRLMLQWDIYLQINKKHPLFATHMLTYFKKYDNESYKNFRTMMQLLDFATLEIQTVEYQPKLLVCAFLYLVLGKEMGVFKLKSITNQFPRSSLYLIEDSLFNDLFLNFLFTTFNLTQHEILPAVQYCASFFILPLNYDHPMTAINPNEEITGAEFEDYCTYQTYNQHMKSYINRRYRGIYQ